jgi:hypothetical protein
MPGATRASPISFISGQVIYHQWDESHRLVETAKTFYSLDELLAQCLAPPSGHLVDRITVDGLDAQGRRRQLVLSFQALTEP